MNDLPHNNCVSAPHEQPSMPQLRLGLAMWNHAHWRDSVYGEGCQSSERLARYAQVFNTVEGNTSFYATPNPPTVNNWRDATPDDFRFTFKLPQAITHHKQLQHCNEELHDFFSVMTPLLEKTGIWKIQLPAHFGPNALPILADFLRQLPDGLEYGVEVRHPQFFAKGDAERALNRLLIERGCNRIIMDSRPLFALPATTAAIVDAHKKKPRVPVHAIATGHSPVVRFIGQPDNAVTSVCAAIDSDGQTIETGEQTLPKDNDAFFTNWLTQLPMWLAQGRTPYLFVHTPDNADAPAVAIRLYQRLQAEMAKQHSSLALPKLQLHSSGASAQSQQLGLEW